MAVVCGAAVGVAMAAGAPLLVAVANTPPEVCWGQRRLVNCDWLRAADHGVGVARTRGYINSVYGSTSGGVCCGDLHCACAVGAHQCGHRQPSDRGLSDSRVFCHS